MSEAKDLRITMALLSHDNTLQLHAAVISAQLAPSRAALLAGIDKSFAAQLPFASTPVAQILSDIDTMNAAGVLADGSVPLVTWLKNAIACASVTIEANVFRSALEKCSSSTPQRSVTTAFTKNSWIALGDSAIAEGDRIAVDGEKWTILLDRFIIGNVSDLARLGGQFDSVPEYHRYVILNATGEGRALAAPLVWRSDGDRILVTATLAPAGPVVDVWSLHDIDLDNFSEARGIDAAISVLRYCLMTQQGHVDSEGLGRIRQLCERIGNADRLDDLIKLELVRLASVPNGSDGSAPLGFVEHIAGVTVRTHEGDNYRIGLELDFVGAGRWKGDVWLNLPLGDFHHDEAADSAGGIPPDLAAWLKALDDAYGARSDAQKHKSAALTMWMDKLQSADRSIAVQRRRAFVFANQAVHVDLRSIEAISKKLGSLKLINDYESANAAATSTLWQATFASAVTLGHNSPVAAAAKAASDAASAARDVRPADAAIASVAVVSAIYGEHAYRFNARWSQLNKYVQVVLRKIFDEE